MMKKVLITGAGGAAAISVYKSLRNANVEIFMADICEQAPGLFLVDQEHRVLLPKGIDECFVDALQFVCKSLAIDVLYPTVDVELLPIAKEIKNFEAIATHVSISNVDSLSKCLDKYALMETCDSQMPLGRYAIFDEQFDENIWQYPLIIKPRSGAGSRDISLVKNKQAIKRIPRDKNMLVQEYLPGAEYSVDIYLDKNGHCVSAVPRERMKVDSGIAIVSRTLLDKDLIGLAKKAAALTGLTGVANVQFKTKMVLKEAAQERLEEVQHKELAVVRYLEEKFISVEELR